jgi:hypothetical protein
MDIEGEAVIEESLNSSDIEVVEETKKGNLKKPHKPKQARKQSQDEEFDDFIEQPVERQRARPSDRSKKQAQGGYFVIQEEEPEELLPIEKKPLYSKVEIEEQYATTKDLTIKNTDIPERLQRLSNE